MCHLILFLPVCALPIFWFFPFETALPAYLIIVGVSFLIYFKIFKAMRSRVLTGIKGMIGKKGLVIEDIAPEGKIRYSSEIWNAKTDGNCLAKGKCVKISGMKNLMLLVEEVSPD